MKFELPSSFTPVSHRESDDNYHAVVAVLNDRWRVIACKDDIQWILQNAKGRGHGAAWRGSSFHRRRDVLIRVSAQRAGERSPIAMAVLEALPLMFEKGGEK